MRSVPLYPVPLYLGYTLLVAALGMASTAQAQKPNNEVWVGSWAAAPVAAANPNGSFGSASPSGTTLREIVHVSMGGPSLRVILSNEFGTDALIVGTAEVALHGVGSSIVAGTGRKLTFNGHESVTIPAGALVVSDAAALEVKPISDLAISLFLPQQGVKQITRHNFADQTSYAAEGNMVASPELDRAKPFYSWDFVKGVDVKVERDGAAIVAFGDSITDGDHSTRDANARWTDVLAARLAADKSTRNLGVLDEGIGGNRVLHDGTGPNALARFDRDVLAQSGVKYVVLLEGINDIGHAADLRKPYDVVSADDLIDGLTQLARRAHSHGIQVLGATLTPYLGAAYASPAGDGMRQAVNQWIRTTKELDGVIDFDAATVDPHHAGTFLPAYDCGDHLHPNDAGYKAMGDAVDLKLFKR